MSVSYWGIIGYGVKLNDIYKYIDHDKVNSLVRDLINEDIEGDVFDDDTFYGNPYSNFGEFLCEFDKDNIFMYDDNGNDESYFLFEPHYPWHANKNDPKTEEECADKIMAILRQISNGHNNEIRQCIDYVNEVGWG